MIGKRQNSQMWSSGSQVIYREVTHGKVWTVRPVTVIQDSSDLIALYLRNGTHWKVCTPVDSGTNLLHCKVNLHPWRLQDVVWSYGDTVFLIFPENAHAIHVMWDQRHSFVGWYVNLQECLRRTPLGFDFLDQELDIEVSPNLDWKWKDIHHLEEAQQIGLFSPEQVEKILKEGQKVIKNIEEKAPPPLMEVGITGIHRLTGQFPICLMGGNKFANISLVSLPGVVLVECKFCSPNAINSQHMSPMQRFYAMANTLVVVSQARWVRFW